MDKNKWIVSGKNTRIYAFAFLIPILFYITLFIWDGIYPFGTKSNLIWDLEIQYVDYENFFREFLKNRSGGYSFTKSLGGSVIALIGYYLASPFNFLLFLFPPEKIQLFVFLVTGLKIGLCGLTFSIFLQKRFEKIPATAILLLSSAYAFTQYNIGQMSNLSWLDGVYMLPLMMLGVWNYVHTKRRTLLSATVACSIVFNWYTGYMNCLFIVWYYLYEKAIAYVKNKKISIREFAGNCAGFLCAEALGVLLSAFFFLPVVIGQSSGRLPFDKGIFTFITNGQCLDIFRGFLIGSDNPSRNITLFCTLFVLIVVVCFFIDREVSVHEKIAHAGLLMILISTLYFYPLENILCGFKTEDSYAYRYLYIVIMGLLLLAAKILASGKLRKNWVKSISIIIFAFLIMDMEEPFDGKRLWITILILVSYGIVGWLYWKADSKNQKMMLLMGASVFCLEILLNGKYIISGDYTYDSNYYERYVSQQEKLLRDIKDRETEPFYRIEQNLNRDMNSEHNSWHSNEAMAYQYRGIQHYSSSYDQITADIVKNAGYCAGEFPLYYHEPILPMDSLLGVKYFLSDKQYAGLKKVEDISGFDQKQVYENPYSFPLGFFTSDMIYQYTGSDNNPFEYINGLYSAILGKQTEIFTPVSDVITEQDGTNVICKFPNSNTGNEIYGNLCTEGMEIPIYINKKKLTTYSKGFLNHKVFEIGSSNIYNEVLMENFSRNVQEVEFQFYELQMDLFEKVANQIKKDFMKVTSFKDGLVEGTFEAEKKGNLLLTIPYDDAWDVHVNGKKVINKPTNTFLMVPVEKGSNEIQLTYHLKRLWLGNFITILSLIICSWMFIHEKKQFT